MNESYFIFRGSGSDFSFKFHFSMKFMSANRITPDGTTRSTASHLGLFCLPMSHKKDARLIWVKPVIGACYHPARPTFKAAVCHIYLDSVYTR